MLKEFLLKNHQEELQEILDNIDSTCYYSIYVNFVSLFENDADVAQKILHYPRYYLPHCDKSAVEAQKEIAKPEQSVKTKVRIRITAVPITLDQGQIGQLVSASGIIVRISQPTILKTVQRLICRECKHVTFANYEWERQTFADVTNCEECDASKLKPVSGFDLEDSSDCQEIGLQEKNKTDSNVTLTEELRVTLLDDLVDKCRPGDHVEISGVVVRIWSSLEVGERLEATTLVLANSIAVRRKICETSSSQETRDVFKDYWEKCSDNPLLGRDNILASICPQLYGMYTAKLALAVVLAGGVSKCNESGTRVRGEPHLLLVGDPGTGKSQLLRTASRLAIRSVLTTGVGSTAAGLTATAVRDSEGWHLEAGALVLADGGVCCVDEFTTMNSQDRTSVHEAMEQQTISIAKAGLVSTLNSRCSVIAAINPTGGQFTEDEEWQTNLGDPLLSRFDIILLLKDNRNPEWDKLTSDHILKAAYEKKENIVQTDSKNHIELLRSENLWKEDILREYLAYVHYLQPKPTKEAEMVLRATYLYHRSHPDRREERTTVRLLDSLIRLAEGHARLMYRSSIEMIDAIFVAKLVGTGSTFETNLGCPFPTDPMATYRFEGKKLLSIIGLESLEYLLMDVSSLVPAGFQAGQVDLCEVQAGYNKFSENLRKFTPQAIQCAIFCGGSRCKYENSKAWPPVHMAIQNIFSHWVTDDVLAMARPNTAQIIKKDIIAQFQGWSIKTIINLQTPGEHASCGGPLEESGFTYDPNVFMKHGIYYYNFALKDYGDATMSKLLDMVKVVAFAVQEGRVAIHCHAGLGRTGVLIACYLIYSLRVRANDAIRFVRMKRPSAIQTRGQILCIQEFEHFVLPQMIVFPLSSTIGDRKPCSLQSHLKKQHNVLHGYEQRTFKYIPKIVFTICERILQLCDCQEDNSPCEIKYIVSSTSFTQKFISHVLEKLRDNKGNIRHSYSWAESLADSYDCSSSMKACASGSQASSRGTSDDIGRLSDVFCTSPDTPSCDSAFPVLDDNYVDDVLGDGIHGQDLVDNDCYKEIQSHMDLKVAAQNAALETVSTEEAIRALIRDNVTLSDKRKKRLQNYQMDLNHRSTAWQRLSMETDLDILSGLLFEWLETLKHSLLDVDSLSYIVVWSSKPQRCLEKLPSSNRYLLEYLLRFISRLRPMTPECQSLITKRFMAALTQQTIWMKSAFYPSGRNFQKLRRGTAAKLNEFFIRMMNLIEEVNTQEMEKPWTSKLDLASGQLEEMEAEPMDETS